MMQFKMAYGIYLNGNSTRWANVPRKIEAIKITREIWAATPIVDGAFSVGRGLKEAKDAVESDSGLVAVLYSEQIALVLATLFEAYGGATVREYLTVEQIRDRVQYALDHINTTRYPEDWDRETIRKALVAALPYIK